MKFPEGPFSCIVADPPWNFRTYSRKGEGRGAVQHYPCMSLDDLGALPVEKAAARDAHLFMWTTGPMLPQAFTLLAAWGFKYSAVAFVWVKLNKTVDARQLRFVPLLGAECFVGLGHTTRQNAEFVLLGRRGKPTRNSRAIRQIIVSPRREHSRKPDEALERIEAYCDGPRLEMFARSERVGWTAWGNETSKFPTR